MQLWASLLGVIPSRVCESVFLGSLLRQKRNHPEYAQKTDKNRNRNNAHNNNDNDINNNSSERDVHQARRHARVTTGKPFLSVLQLHLIRTSTPLSPSFACFRP